MSVTGIRTNKDTYIIGEVIRVQLDGTCGFGNNFFSIDIKVSTDQKNWTTFSNWTEVMVCVFTQDWTRDVGSMIAPPVIGDYYIGCAHAAGIGAGKILYSKKITVRHPFPPNKGELFITTRPSGAYVDINGVQQVGTTPMRQVLNAGAYTIRVRKEGYVTVETTAFVVASEVLALDFQLVPGGDGIYGLIRYIPWILLAAGVVIFAKIGSDMISARKRRK